MEPIRIEDDGTAVFTTDQIDTWGFPNDKWQSYYVIESPPEMLMGFTHQEHTVFKKIHRYDRDSRFRTCLRNLLGDTRSKIDEQFLSVVKHYMKDSKKPYQDCRKIVAHYRRTGYYALIPSMLIRMGFTSPIEKPKDLDRICRKVFDDYKKFESKFARYKKDRKYFPNMKFLALKLLEENGVVCNVPKLQTGRRLVLLEELYSKVSSSE